MQVDINKTCCFTGHRELPPNDLKKIRMDVEFEIEKHYVLYGVDTFISGGALGFDMLAAEQVIAARSRHPDIKLIFAFPCSDHSKKWSDSEATRLHILSLYANEVICLSDNYYTGCMHNRNRYMLENSAYCVSYCKKNYGGTFYTLNLAKKMNKIITEL